LSKNTHKTATHHIYNTAMIINANFVQGQVTEIGEYETAKDALVKLPMLNYPVISGISHL
jgi:hypothetical protein